MSGNTRGIYNQEPTMPDFRDFLDNFEKKKELLPTWWSKAKRRECGRMARRGGWSDIGTAVEKGGHYGALWGWDVAGLVEAVGGEGGRVFGYGLLLEVEGATAVSWMEVVVAMAREGCIPWRCRVVLESRN